MKALVLIFCFFACLVFGKEVESEGSYSASNLTAEQLKQKALEEARNEAIRKAFGIKIENTSVSGKSETKDFLAQVYSELTKTETRGLITEEKIISESINFPEVGNKQILTCTVKIRANVEKLETDENLKLRLDLNKETFSENEELSFKVWSGFDCFVTVFNFTEDGIFVIFPNGLVTENFLKAENSFEFPDKILREVGLSLKTSLPQDNLTNEFLFAVASKVKFPFASKLAKKQGEFLFFETKDFVELNRWLVQLGKNHATATAGYTIGK
ncbi:hypothetical protein IT568_01165 [bacterium]|nr:hypothetical protein [bacterium]